MDDLISRAEAIDAIYEHEFANWCDKDEVSTVLNDLPSAQPEQRWIPVSEKLPEVREWVLCQCRAGIMDVLRLTEDGDWNKNYPHAEYMSGFVIAWMPLPEPYKEEGEQE